LLAGGSVLRESELATNNWQLTTRQLFMRGRFIISAARPEQFPNGAQGVELPEVAFLGRSNVGKSSLLNVLVNDRNLAFTSSRPGCTQLINFFQIGDEFVFADLPGYGFAHVPKHIKQEWKKLIDFYLLRRSPLRLCIVLLDARRGWMEKDLELKGWLEFHRRPFMVVATKIDKLTQREERNGIAGIRKHYPEGDLVPFSAVTGRGVREIWQAIRKIKASPPTTATAQP
jgi:GTP-binding protein